MDNLPRDNSAPVESAAEPVLTSQETALTAQQESLHNLREAMEHNGRSGANWFYWVAGLSLVNSAIQHGGGDTYFVVGLGMTLVVDVISNAAIKENPDAAQLLHAVGLGFSLCVALVVAAF